MRYQSLDNKLVYTIVLLTDVLVAVQQVLVTYGAIGRQAGAAVTAKENGIAATLMLTNFRQDSMPKLWKE